MGAVCVRAYMQVFARHLHTKMVPRWSATSLSSLRSTELSVFSISFGIYAARVKKRNERFQKCVLGSRKKK